MAPPHTLTITPKTKASKPDQIDFSSPPTTTSATINPPNSMTDPIATPNSNPFAVPKSTLSASPTSDPTTTAPTAPASPFLPISLGFPRVIDVSTYPRDTSPTTNITIPDLVITVLYNFDLVNDKNVLAAFLDFANTEFCFVRRDLGEGSGGLHFHIEREGDVVLYGYQSQPGVWQDHYVYRIEPSGVWKPVAVDTEESSLVVANDASEERNMRAFVEDVLANERWIARPPFVVIEVAVKHAI